MIGYKEAWKYTSFSKEEVGKLAATSIISGFILSFTKWGETTFDPYAGLTALFITFIVMLIVLTIKVGVQKLTAIRYGHKLTYMFGTYSTPIVLFTALFSNGSLPFIAPGRLHADIVKKLRIGLKPIGRNAEDLARTAKTGLFVTLAIAILARMMQQIMPSLIIDQIVISSVMIAFMSILPFPELEGSDIFLYKKGSYAFMLILVMAASILIFTPLPTFPLLFLSFLCAIIGFFAYSYFVELS